MSTPRERLLQLFHSRGDTYVSGAEMSELLGVSRTSIWKHISQLRAQGFDIEAVPSQGYRLLSLPDRLIPEEIRSGLSSSCIGTRIDLLSETDSTNRVAYRLAEEGAEEGTVVIAEKQTAGKGRMGRAWISPEGINLYCSIILRPGIPPFDAPKLTFLSVVALAEAIEICCGIKATAKWPNDILIDGKKMAGMLNEMAAESDQVRFVIMGIGVNLNMREDQFPPGLRYPATSLMLESGRTIDRVAFTRTLLERLDHHYLDFRNNGFTGIRIAWERLCDFVGKEVEVTLGDRIQRGTVSGLAEDGALLLRCGSSIETIYAGDVRPLP